MYLTSELSDDDASDVNLGSEKIAMERHIRASFPVKEDYKVNIKIAKKIRSKSANHQMHLKGKGET